MKPNMAAIEEYRKKVNCKRILLSDEAPFTFQIVASTFKRSLTHYPTPLAFLCSGFFPFGKLGGFARYA